MISLIIDILNNNNKIIQLNHEDYGFNNTTYKFSPVIVNRNTLQKYTYTIIGILNNNLNVFYWGWSTNYEKNKLYIIRKLINYAIDIEPKNISEFYIKKILTTSSIKIYNNSHLELIIAIANYYLKSKINIIQTINNYTIYYSCYEIKESDKEIL